MGCLMQAVDNNVPDAPYYVPGKYIPNANNFLHAPPGTEGVPASGWINNVNLGISVSGNEAYDHLHYVAGPSGTNPTEGELSVAPFIRGASLVVAIILFGLDTRSLGLIHELGDHIHHLFKDWFIYSLALFFLKFNSSCSHIIGSTTHTEK